MSVEESNRRNFLGLGLSIVGAVLASSKARAHDDNDNDNDNDDDYSCEEIDYPKKGYTMKMEHMQDIGTIEAKRMGLQVYECQRQIAAKQMINHILRLKLITINGVNLLDHAIRAASLAKEEMNNKKHEDEYVVASFLFNVGKVISPKNASNMLAAILKPYLDENLHLALLNYDKFRRNPLIYKSKPWYNSACCFAKWQDEAFVLTPNKCLKLSKLKKEVKSLFWADAIFKDIPHEKVIPI